MTLRSPFLSRSVARQDPEAADLVEFTYQEYCDRIDLENLEDVESLAALSLRYPNNPYVLYNLACRIDKGYLDPEILNRIADRLLQIDPANSRYYFLKACAAFYNWDENGAEKAVEYLEQCFSGSAPYDPYDLYKDRTCKLVEQENPLLTLSDKMIFCQCFDSYQLRELIQNLLTYTQDLIINGQSERARQLHDRLQRLAECSIPEKIEYPWQNFRILFKPDVSFYQKTPQMIELQWMKLDPQRARQDRLQMLAWMNFSKDLGVKWKKEKTESEIPSSRWSWDWYPAAGHGFQMTLASLAGLAVFAGIGLLAGMRRSRLSAWSFVLATLFFILYFLICRASDYQEMHDDWCGGRAFILYSETIWDILCNLKPFAVYGLAAAFAVAAITAGTYWIRRKRPGLFGRIIFRFCVVLFILSLWLAVSRLRFATPIFDLLVLLVCIPLLCFPLRNLRRKEYLPFLSRSTAGKEFRGRCLVLGGYAVIFHLIAFALSAPALAETVNAVFIIHKQERTWPTVIPNRYIVDPNSYPAFLSQFETENYPVFMGQWLAMVEPEDIPKVLTVLQERRKKEPYPLGGMMGMESESQKEFLARCNYLPGLHNDMEWCGRDAWPAIIPFISDPNRIEMLLLREQTDDPAACNRMVELWRKNREGPFTLEPSLMQCFNRRQKGKLIEQWLPVSEESRKRANYLDILQYNSELSPTSREWLWRQMIDQIYQFSKHGFYRDLTLASKPADYHISDDLLNECLGSKNERLRVMGQHIYQKMGKPLDEEILRKWAADPHFLVRANAALRAPDLIGADEPSAFVRLVQGLAKSGSTTK